MRLQSVWCYALLASLTFGMPARGGKANPISRLDVPPTAKQKLYAPADGAVVAVTPPPFIWVPAGRDLTYTLQVSRSRIFAAESTRTWDGISTSVFVPREPLAAGQWYWRYGITVEGKKHFGRPRPFVVPGNAREFPFPNFDEVIARVPREHPRVLLTGAVLERVRVAARQELKDEVAALAARCRDVVGAELVAEPRRPSTGPQRVTVMRTTRPPMDEMEQCALAYLLTGDEELGQEAKRRLLHFFSWDPKGSSNLWSYDEPAMWVMMRGTRAYDWTYDLFTAAERERIEPVMRERARQFYVHLKDKRRFETDPYESHAGRMPGFLGEAALCFAHEWPEAKPWLEYATLLYYTSYPAWGGDDGGWHEGIAYWSAYMSFALHYVAALKNVADVDLTNKPFFRNTPYYALYTAPPYFMSGHFGDGATGSPRGAGYVMYAFSSLLNDPYIRWYHAESGVPVGRNLLTLACYDPTVEPKNPIDLPQGRAFPSAGLAAVHTALGDKDDDIALVLKSSPFGSVSHGHADANAFIIEAFGRSLAMKTGYYPWYGSPHHQQWTRDTRSSNSLLVNGEGQMQRSWEATGRIVTFHTTEHYAYIEAEAGWAYGDRLERFRRHILHVRPGVFVIFDDIVADSPSTYQWLLHAQNRIDIDGQTLNVQNDPARMRVDILAPAKLKITQNDEYEPEPEQQEHKSLKVRNTWHLTAATAEPSRSCRYVSVFQVHKDGEQPRFAVELMDHATPGGLGAVGVRLSTGSGSVDTIVFQPNSTGTNDGGSNVQAEARDMSGKRIRSLALPLP